MRNFTEITYTPYEGADLLSGFFTVWEDVNHAEGDQQPHVLDLDFYVTKLSSLMNADPSRYSTIATDTVNQVNSGEYDLNSLVLIYIVQEAELLAIDLDTEQTIRRIQKKQQEIIQMSHSFVNKMFAKIQES